MENKQFFSMLSRMKYITRWGLMRNVRSENICEHSYDVAVIAHALGVIKNKRYGGDVDCERLAVLALFHDCSEIITGDLPTPIKYYSKNIKSAYDEIEDVATNKLLSYLPDDIKKEYDSIFLKDNDEEELWKIVKAADRISALIKCIEEKQMGNMDFIKAEETIMKNLSDSDLPEVKCFLQEFIPSFNLTLDDQA